MKAGYTVSRMQETLPFSGGLYISEMALTGATRMQQEVSGLHLRATHGPQKDLPRRWTNLFGWKALKSPGAKVHVYSCLAMSSPWQGALAAIRGPVAAEHRKEVWSPLGSRKWVQVQKMVAGAELLQRWTTLVAEATGGKEAITFFLFFSIYPTLWKDGSSNHVTCEWFFPFRLIPFFPAGPWFPDLCFECTILCAARAKGSIWCSSEGWKFVLFVLFCWFLGSCISLLGPMIVFFFQQEVMLLSTFVRKVLRCKPLSMRVRKMKSTARRLVVRDQMWFVSRTCFCFFFKKKLTALWEHLMLDDLKKWTILGWSSNTGFQWVSTHLHFLKRASKAVCLVADRASNQSTIRRRAFWWHEKGGVLMKMKSLGGSSYCLSLFIIIHLVIVRELNPYTPHLFFQQFVLFPSSQRFFGAQSPSCRMLKTALEETGLPNWANMLLGGGKRQTLDDQDDQENDQVKSIIKTKDGVVLW